MTMINELTGIFQQYCDQLMTWYYAAGTLAQYSVIIALGITAFLVTVVMILSMVTK